MIVIVDDDEAILSITRHALSTYELKAFTSATEALKFCSSTEPSLCIVDIMMPVMDGFTFQQSYRELYPHRHTPFIFLSSLIEPDVVVRGLDSGAVDYINKPVDSRVLQARVRSVLRRQGDTSHALFEGDLILFPFVKVLQFCENNGLTGHVAIRGESLDIRLDFHAGSLKQNDAVSDEVLERVLELTDGTFVIYSRPIDFQELDAVKVVSGTCPAEGSQIACEKPTGVLSGIKVGGRLFQIQTEFVPPPVSRIVSIVILDGKTVLKRQSDPLTNSPRQELEKLIRESHLAIEREVHVKLSSLPDKKRTTENATPDFVTLLQMGMDHYLEQEYQQALDIWNQAARMNPTHEVLAMNRRIVRKRLGLPDE